MFPKHLAAVVVAVGSLLGTTTAQTWYECSSHASVKSVAETRNWVGGSCRVFENGVNVKKLKCDTETYEPCKGTGKKCLPIAGEHKQGGKVYGMAKCGTKKYSIMTAEEQEKMQKQEYDEFADAPELGQKPGQGGPRGGSAAESQKFWFMCTPHNQIKMTHPVVKEFFSGTCNEMSSPGGTKKVETHMCDPAYGSCNKPKQQCSLTGETESIKNPDTGKMETWKKANCGPNQPEDEQLHVTSIATQGGRKRPAPLARPAEAGSSNSNGEEALKAPPKRPKVGTEYDPFNIPSPTDGAARPYQDPGAPGPM